MKTSIFRTIAITLILFTSVSCKDWLELLPPSGLIREEFYKSKEDLEAVLMAAYSSFASLDGTLFLAGEVRGDMHKSDYSQSSSEKLIMENNIYADNSYTNWQSFYKVVNYCNEVIKNAPEVQKIDKTFNDYLKQGLVSEAIFLRSLAYFYLVRIYKEVPLVLEPSETDDNDFYVSKSSEEEVLKQITDDLEEYRVYAPSGGFKTIAENKGRASKAAFDALLTDVCLWKYDYEGALKYATNVEMNTDIVLLPTAKWFELFYPGNSLEGIFEFQFNDNLNQKNNMYGMTERNAHKYDPSQKAVEKFGFKYASELVRGEESTIKKLSEDDFIIWKYVGQAPDGQSERSGSEKNSCNWIVYRLADVMLMKAEALSQLQRYNEAYEILRKIRERAGVQPLTIANTPNSYEDAIMEERVLELAYEGKRWFDLLRMGRRNNYARKDKLIEVLVSNVPSTQKRILAVKLTNPWGWFLPVYEGELERNKNLVQNPYYDK